LTQHCDADQLGKALAVDTVGILRAKGFVIDSDGQTQLLQVVGRRFKITPYPSDIKPQLVCIGLRNKFNRAELEKIIMRAGGTVAVL
jgi:hypothetical protein